MNPFAPIPAPALRAINVRLSRALPVRIHLTADDAPKPAPVAAKRVVRKQYAPKGAAKLIVEALREHGPMTSAQIASITGVASKRHRRALRHVLKRGVVVEQSRGPIVWAAK